MKTPLQAILLLSLVASLQAQDAEPEEDTVSLEWGISGRWGEEGPLGLETISKRWHSWLRAARQGGFVLPADVAAPVWAGLRWGAGLGQAS